MATAAARPPATTSAATQPQPQSNGTHASLQIANSSARGDIPSTTNGRIQQMSSDAMKGAQIASSWVNGSMKANVLTEGSAEVSNQDAGKETASRANGYVASLQKHTLAEKARISEPDPGEPIQAYAKLELPGFSYYIQTLSVSIGRRPAHSAPLNGNERGSDTHITHNRNQDEADVDVDLGPLKSISRLHARIYYHTGLIPSWGVAPGVSYANLQSPHGATGYGLDTSYATFDASRALHAQSEGSGRFVLEVAGRNGAFVDDVFVGKGAIVPLGRRTKIQIAERVFYFVLPPPQKATSESAEGGSAQDLSSSLSESSSSDSDEDKEHDSAGQEAAAASDRDSLGDSSALSDVDGSSDSGGLSAAGVSTLKRPRLIIKYRPRHAEAKDPSDPAHESTTAEKAATSSSAGKKPSDTANKLSQAEPRRAASPAPTQQQRAGKAPAKGKGKGKGTQQEQWQTNSLTMPSDDDDDDMNDDTPVLVPAPTSAASPPVSFPSPTPTSAPSRSEAMHSMSPTFAASPPPPIPANKRGRGRPRKDGMPNKSTKRKLDAAAAEEAAIAAVTGLPPPAPPPPTAPRPTITASPPRTLSAPKQTLQPQAKKQRIEPQLWTTGIGVAGRKRRRGDGVEDEPTLAVGTPIGIEALEAERRARVARQRKMAASQSVEKDSDTGSSNIKVESSESRDGISRPPETMTARERYAALLKSAPPPIQHKHTVASPQHTQRGVSTSSMSPPPAVRHVPIFVGSAPSSTTAVGTQTTGASEAGREPPPIVHHEGKLFLSPAVFGHMSAQEISRLESLGATEAVATLMSGLVSHLNERKRHQPTTNGGLSDAGSVAPSTASVGIDSSVSHLEAPLPAASVPSASPAPLPLVDQSMPNPQVKPSASPALTTGDSAELSRPESKKSSGKDPLAALGALASHPEAAGLVALLKQQQEAGASSGAVLSLTPAQLQLLQMANQLADDKAAKKAEKKKRKKAEKAAAAAAAATIAEASASDPAPAAPPAVQSTSPLPQSVPASNVTPQPPNIEASFAPP